MTEEKRVLAQEELTAVAGGDEKKTCPQNKRYPNKSCDLLDCPYRSGFFCNLYNADIPGILPPLHDIS